MHVHCLQATHTLLALAMWVETPAVGTPQPPCCSQRTQQFLGLLSQQPILSLIIRLTPPPLLPSRCLDTLALPLLPSLPPLPLPPPPLSARSHIPSPLPPLFSSPSLAPLHPHPCSPHLSPPHPGSLRPPPSPNMVPTDANHITRSQKNSSAPNMLLPILHVSKAKLSDLLPTLHCCSQLGSSS